MSYARPVTVRELPKNFSSGDAQRLLLEVAVVLEYDRPRIVFDFSKVCQFDSTGVAALLNCTEEAMKKNGDIKLAAISPSALEMLEAMQVDHLFEIFATTSEAVDSFQLVPGYHIPFAPDTWAQDASQASGDD